MILKNCPVCDEEPYINSYPHLSLCRMLPTRYSVECPKCRSCGGIRLTEKEAVDSWNDMVDDHHGVFGGNKNV